MFSTIRKVLPILPLVILSPNKDQMSSEELLKVSKASIASKKAQKTDECLDEVKENIRKDMGLAKTDRVTVVKGDARYCREKVECELDSTNKAAKDWKTCNDYAVAVIEDPSVSILGNYKSVAWGEDNFSKLYPEDKMYPPGRTAPYLYGDLK